MADNVPNLPGAVPPKPAESKVQPKKETVRITLPPKPSATASPTIKLPSLPAASTSAAPPSASAPPPPSAHTPLPPPMSSAPAGAKLSSMPGPKSAPAAPRSAAALPQAHGAGPSSAPVSAGQKVSVFDKILAIAAMIVSLAAVGCMVYLMMMFKQDQ